MIYVQDNSIDSQMERDYNVNSSNNSNKNWYKSPKSTYLDLYITIYVNTFNLTTSQPHSIMDHLHTYW